MPKQFPKDVFDTLGSMEIAQKIADNFHSDSVESVTVQKPGFICVAFSNLYLINELRENIIKPKLIECKTNSICNVLVDFSSPNIAKEMHVGHLRSTIHGESISRMLEYIGLSVKRINHIGDWGTQFGILIEYIIQNKVDIYSNNLTLSVLNSLYQSSRDLFDSNDEFKTKARNRVVLLQQKEKESYTIWKRLVKLSEIEFKKIYQRLDIKLETYGESFYHDMIADDIERCKKLGIVKIVDNATCLFVDDYKKFKLSEVPLMLQKSNGSYGYDSTDVSTILYRIEKLKCNCLIYITDIGQKDHFLRLFQATKKLGIENVDLWHLGLGLICGADGKKFKTRSGETVRLIDLLDESVSRSKEILKIRRSDFTPEELETAATSIGHSSVKYFDLNQICSNNYNFDYERMLDPKGNTAVYILYTYARMNALLKKLNMKRENCEVNLCLNDIELQSIYERKLVVHLLRFSEYLDEVLEILSMHKLCDYLYDLCNLYSLFYENCRVVGCDQQNSRTIITVGCMKLVETICSILGLKLLESI
uniref:arginine--tRNA ligase n=1 Tax=Dermatophagoides pteronyssinus TaxID=6956 RepID=A0A6P6YBS2_DERPT|nr:uncharacterized protein LOC113796734 [Dermatophagoides pteronyssinus]